jgi:hypothetical protein
MWRHFQALAGGSVLAITLGACHEDVGAQAEVVAQARAEQPPDVRLERVAFARLAEGRVVARGTASFATYRHAVGKLEASSLDARLAPGAHAPAELGALAVRAPSAEGQLQTRDGAGWGGVRVLAQRGDRAATERLEIRGASNDVHAPGPVEASGPGYVVRGRSLTARSDGRRIDLTGGVTGQLSGGGAR